MGIMKLSEEKKGYPVRKKRSSFWMHEPELVFNALCLRRGESFLDLGCGPGDYSIEAARRMENSGVVYGVDVAEKMIKHLQTEADALGMRNIRTKQADITHTLPFTDHYFDVCLIATVLHIPGVSNNMKGVMAEVHRVLKPSGRFVVIDCNKNDLSMGPPEYMRLSAEEIVDCAMECGFEKTGQMDFGFNYCIQFGIR